jgi:hypothetical protein
MLNMSVKLPITRTTKPLWLLQKLEQAEKTAYEQTSMP